ncbi:LAFE_0C00474g1_1 [Lachancea fermentati]|uniref:LAFE_0C00474g1_1 n=1 Tax=Lachancea fermentati TaxID=4955 RepID=A0A1G4M8W3_LACFM|nr:LAFE_0C00474g1_1 [Lachancea fermentati]
MHSASQPKPGRLWSKFKSSTKSLSTSLSQLSLKQERDGDSPNTTMVHKALVKFYSSQEPFQGFPEWLGHKEDLPDEQKVLRKQKNHVQETNHSIVESRTKKHSHNDPAVISPVKKTAGTDFRNIYKGVSNSSPSSSLPKSSGEFASAASPGETPRTSYMLMRERLKKSSQKMNFM